MGFVVPITKELLGRLSAFEDRPGPSLSLASQLESYVGQKLPVGDAFWLYVDALVVFLDASKGAEMGASFFAEEIRHGSDRHRMWFAVLSPDRETYQALCQQMDREMSSKDPYYLSRYYQTLSAPSAELLAQFQEGGRGWSFRAEDAKPVPGAVVYRWGPPE